jgi:hypothetical protein
LADLYPSATEDTATAIEGPRNAIEDGTFEVFSGEIKDQNGDVQVAAGESLDDGAMLGMNWFVEGVEGNIE